MKNLIVSVLILVSVASCVTKKKYVDVQNKLSQAEQASNKCKDELVLATEEKLKLQNDLSSSKSSLSDMRQQRENEAQNFRNQIEDLKKVRDTQFAQVEGLTILSKAANENINKTLSQIENKEKYIKQILAAKNKVDSMNLALALNLKTSIGLDINDKDVDIKVDKTVVFINLSDAMMYSPGSYKLTPRANEVLAKIAKVIKARADLDVMVEGYTDNTPIHTAILDDNWDLSVKRSTTVVRSLQQKHGINPNRLVAAGRGEYNTLKPNNSKENMAMNRRTRIILLPKLDQFYDLLNPELAKK
ncbi:chemotaxis protein MotB [Spirosomataceae bacterium TFI 002]|nr:chemotaxis protein MotB [Spirosomataceae bacterium TFI 002]